MKCCVKYCNNYTSDKTNLSFFKFPEEKTLLKQWLDFCDVDDTALFKPKTWRICMEHFNSDDIGGSVKFDMGFSTKRYLEPGAIPRINKNSRQLRKKQPKQNGTKTISKTNDDVLNAKNISERPKQQKSKKIQESLEYIVPETLISINCGDETKKNTRSQSNRKQFLLEAQVKMLQEEVINLKRKNQIIQQELNNVKKKHLNRLKVVKLNLAKTD